MRKWKVNKHIVVPILTLCVLGGIIYLTIALLSPPDQFPTREPLLDGACTALCLDNGDHCVFGANQDNSLEIGMMFVNKRNVLKTTWDPSTSGEYVRWISRYGSVTVNFVGYQMAWAGMNEAGLMLSTMSLAETQPPRPDERPPFNGPFWMQYQLDTHSTVEQVIASDANIRLDESAVDHYLVCDRTGACAVIEFMDGQLVYHTSESLPVKASTNNPYEDSVSAWENSLLMGSQPEDNSLWRFATAANNIRVFETSTSEDAIAYAFETLKAVSREDTVWSFVFDPTNLRVNFRTNDNPNIRYVDFASLDFSCKTPVEVMDVHANLTGDISNKFIPYTHSASFTYTTDFFKQFQRVMSPIMIDTLLWGLESFPCQDGDISTQTDLALYRPLIPPTMKWAGLMILHRVVPFWIPLVVLSLAYVVWLMAIGQPSSSGKRLTWALVTLILGPLGLLAYLLSHQKKRQPSPSKLARQ